VKEAPKAAPVVSPGDPRLAGLGAEDVAGADQIDGMLAMSADERLDSLVAMVAFAEELRTGRVVARGR
jgi:hypothetical protein